MPRRDQQTGWAPKTLNGYLFRARWLRELGAPVGEGPTCPTPAPARGIEGCDCGRVSRRGWWQGYGKGPDTHHLVAVLLLLQLTVRGLPPLHLRLLQLRLVVPPLLLNMTASEDGDNQS